MTHDAHQKVKASHLKRSAYLYVRQSTLRQVLENTESTQRLEAEWARRRYLRVDPDNRLVADSLEADWNAKLKMLAEAQELCERQREQDMMRHGRVATSSQHDRQIGALLNAVQKLLAPPDLPKKHPY